MCCCRVTGRCVVAGHAVSRLPGPGRDISSYFLLLLDPDRGGRSVTLLQNPQPWNSSTCAAPRQTGDPNPCLSHFGGRSRQTTGIVCSTGFRSLVSLSASSPQDFNSVAFWNGSARAGLLGWTGFTNVNLPRVRVSRGCLELR